MPTVLVTETLDSHCADWLAQYVDLVWCHHEKQTDELTQRLAGADGLIVRTYTQVDAALLDRATKLKVVGRAGVGLDNIDLDVCRQRGVQVVYTPDANTQAVVEYVFGLMLDTFRPRVSLDVATFHEQRKVHVGKQLSDLTLGILGCGRIGKRMARAAVGLGITRVLVNDLLPEAELRGQIDLDVTFVDKPTLYSQSDILTIHVDGRAPNRHMIDDAMLSQLKPNCLLINAARGMLVDNTALARWATAHCDAHVILDVHDPEPPPPPPEVYPLHDKPNVRLLPHLASRTDTALRNMSWVVRDVAAVLAGQVPQHPA